MSAKERKATLRQIAMLMILVIIGVFVLVFVKVTQRISRNKGSPIGSSLRVDRLVNLSKPQGLKPINTVEQRDG